MSVEFSWKVNALKYGNEPGFVNVAQFADCSYVATETVGVTTYVAEERVIFELDQPSEEGYIAFEEITQDLVLEWLTSKIDDVSEEELESKQSKLSYIIQQQINGTEVHDGTPWEPVPEKPVDVDNLLDEELEPVIVDFPEHHPNGIVQEEESTGAGPDEVVEEEPTT